MSYADDYQDIAHRAGWVTLPARSRLRVTGRHRHRFIHNMTTCEINNLKEGQGGFGLAVDRGGKIVAQFIVHCEPEALVLEVKSDRVDALQAHLQSFIVADRVVFERIEDPTVLCVVGPESVALVASACGCELASFEPFSVHSIAESGVVFCVRKNPLRATVPAVDIVCLGGSEARVKSLLQTAGVGEVSIEGYEAHRVEAAIPVDGIDMGEENIPLESPVLTEGISWDKGCYIGQEVIARMHYRGQPNRYLRRIALVSDRCPAPGTQLIDGDERVIGRMGTAAFHPPSDAWMGLAVMKRKFAEAGQKVWDPEGEVGTVLLEDAAGSE